MNCPVCDKNSIRAVQRFQLIFKVEPRCTECGSQLEPQNESQLLFTLVFAVSFGVACTVYPITGSPALGLGAILLSFLPLSFVKLQNKSQSGTGRRAARRKNRV